MVTPPVAREEAIAVVDPYTSGRFLVDELCQRGWPLVAVRSSLRIHDALLGTWNAAPFEQIVVHKGVLAQTVSALRSGRRIRAVVAGSEPGVELTDALSEALGLRGNGTELTQCRWDKYHMHERLRECGLRACQQRQCKSVEEAVEFARGLSRWPLIAKPCASYGSSSVFRCEDMEALVEAVLHVLGATNVVGRENDVALVQECLDGTEYVVDCVSFDGKHFVSAMWAYKKTNLSGGFAYDHTRTVPYSAEEGSVQAVLYKYVFECLTALGIQNGASHSEVMYNESEGPCLVETGARMHGSVGPALWAECAGREQSQAYLVADAFTEDGQELLRKMAAVRQGQPAYTLAHFSMQVDLQCHEGGVLTNSIEGASGEWLRSLPTFWKCKFFVEVGDRLETTRDMFSSPGYIILLGDAAAVERDADSIRDRERSGGMYHLKLATVPSIAVSDDAHTAGMLSVSRRNSLKTVATSNKLHVREFETEVEKLLSPLVSRAFSPVLSPQQAPAALPEGVGDLVEFTLDGEGLDDLDGFELEPTGEPE